TTTDQGISLSAQLNLMSGHHNMIYALLRTAPMTRRSLAHVPQGTAGVLAIGLNPAGPPAATAAGEAPPSISAMDLGREFFHNIEEISAFALCANKADGPRPIPEIGAVIAGKDPAKSEALWNQILSLVALAGARSAQPPGDVDIEGRKGRVYHFDQLPPISVVRGDRELLIGTQAAVAAALRAQGENNSIAKDP